MTMCHLCGQGGGNTRSKKEVSRGSQTFSVGGGDDLGGTLRKKKRSPASRPMGNPCHDSANAKAKTRPLCGFDGHTGRARERRLRKSNSALIDAGKIRNFRSIGKKVGFAGHAGHPGLRSADDENLSGPDRGRSGGVPENRRLKGFRKDVCARRSGVPTGAK